MRLPACDEESDRRYRIGGRFDVAFANLARFHQRAAGTGIHVIWQGGRIRLERSR